MHSFFRKVSSLAGGDEKSQRRRVPVLEEVQAQATLRRELDRLSSTGLAIPSGDHVAVTRLDCDASEILQDRRGVAPRGLLVGGGAERCDVEAARAAKFVAGSLKVLLVGEQEDERALLALILLRHVKVEDGARGRVDLTVVAGTIGPVWVLTGDGDNEVRGLVSTSERCLAG